MSSIKSMYFDEYDARKTVIFLYLIVPIFYYGIPLLYSLEGGGITMHFFETFYINSASFAKSLFTHFVVGVSLVKLLAFSDFKVRFTKTKSIYYQFFLASFFAFYLLSPVGYVGVIVMPLFVIFASTFRPNSFGFLLLLLIAGFNLIENYNRYPFLMVIMIWLLPMILELNYKRLFLCSVIAVFFLIFVLQPIRAGVIPFVSGSELSQLTYFFQHLNPIYIGAFVHLEYDFTFEQLLAESIPLMKGVLGLQSVVEVIDQNFMPASAPARLGSNTNMYYGVLGFSVLMFMLFYIGCIIRFVKSKVISNAFIMLFIIQGPFFIRRSVGSLIVDMIVLIIFGLFFVFIYNSAVRQRAKNMENLKVRL